MAPDGTPIPPSRKARRRAQTKQSRQEAREELRRFKERTRGKHPLHDERERAITEFIGSKTPELVNATPRERKRAHGNRHRHGKVRIYR